jgi:uncharacterized membrane protein
MWIYLGILFLTFGIWQAFKQGSLSPILSTVGLLVGIIIIFFSSWAIGIILLILFGLFALFSKIIGNDKKKIQHILLAYRDYKQKNPTATEDVLCRMVIAGRLYHTRFSNQMGIKTTDDAIKYVTHIFANIVLTIESTCHWIISIEKGELNKFGNLKSSTEMKTMLENRTKLDNAINYYKTKILP